MRVATLASALATLTALTAAHGAAAAGPLYLPLADGNRWVLQAESGAASTISVTRTATGLVLKGVPGAGDLRVRRVGQAIEAWDAGERRWEPFLRLGAPAGTRYAVALSTSPLWRTLVVTVASRQAVVEDARGKVLRTCVRLTFAAGKATPDAGVEELVFAPAVGFASTTVQTIAGPRESLLAAVRLR